MLNYILLQETAGKEGGSWGMIAMMVGMFAIMYFLMIRPQQKKAKKQKEFLSNLKKGAKVVTIGGMHGKISAIDEEGGKIEVEVAKGVKLTFAKSAVSMENTVAPADDKKDTIKAEAKEETSEVKEEEAAEAFDVEKS